MRHSFILFISILFTCGCDVSWVASIAPPGNSDPPDTTATISWKAPVENSDGSVLDDLESFRIYHSTSPGECLTIDPMVEVGPDILSYSNFNLTPGRHYFSVTAVDDDGNESICSTEVFKDI